MPYGIHFVSESENPVGFWLWRIATAVQDAEEYQDEAAGLVTDVEDTALHRLASDLPGVQRNDAHLEADADDAGRELSEGQSDLRTAQAVADGKDAHDAATVATLQQIFAKVAGERDIAQSNADSSFEQVEKHPF